MGASVNLVQGSLATQAEAAGRSDVKKLLSNTDKNAKTGVLINNELMSFADFSPGGLQPIYELAATQQRRNELRGNYSLYLQRPPSPPPGSPGAPQRVPVDQTPAEICETFLTQGQAGGFAPKVSWGDASEEFKTRYKQAKCEERDTGKPICQVFHDKYNVTPGITSIVWCGNTVYKTSGFIPRQTYGTFDNNGKRAYEMTNCDKYGPPPSRSLSRKFTLSTSMQP
ncbi:hypothetical protein WJX73_009579 [Symbiochloris irregularis]|uniref:Uncharacterized protein n=1 Tax=Symbiochloris irregularis TaxID=706552 RepID=A0AAW1NNW5_9CHLO